MIGFELSPGGTGGLPRQATPLAAFFRQGGGNQVALAQGVGGDVTVWTEVGPHHAACLRLDSENPNTRLSWRETLIAELRNVYPVGRMSLTGSWSQMQTSGSGRSGSYTGNRAISTGSTGAAASVTVDRAEPYDLWINYTGRTNGGYVRVDIDGSQALVNEIADPDQLGYKAFPTYAATDLTRRQSVKVASGLTGAHDVSFRLGGTASPGGNVIMVEAAVISGALGDPDILPPFWTEGASYAMGDEVQFGGTFYAARGNGVSGIVGPTHTGGVGSDGALDWKADNRPTYPEFVAIDYASEREYAVRFDVAGDTTELGGQTHGNETVNARSIMLDGSEWVPTETGSGLSLGSQIMFVEDLTWQTQAGAPVGSCQLARTVTPGAISHSAELTGTGPRMDIAWFYTSMLPIIRWDGESQSTVTDTVHVPSHATVNLADFAGQTPTNRDFPAQTRMGLTGQVSGAVLLYGHESAILPTTTISMAKLDSFLRPNIDGRSESGSQDWTAKGYVIATAPGGLRIENGDKIGFSSRHVLAVT